MDRLFVDKPLAIRRGDSTVMQPTLSVVMPNFNHARFLPESLSAILDQSHRPLEVIVIDDASSDDSVAVVERLAQQDPLIQLIRNERNRGVIDSFNRGIELARGDYILGAAADDRVLPGFFEKSLQLLARYPEAGFCSTDSLVIDEEGNELHGYYPPTTITRSPVYLPPERALLLLRRYVSWFQGNTTIYRRDVVRELGGFRADLGSFTDQFQRLVIALRHGACYIPEPLGVVRIMTGNYSARARSDPQAYLTSLRRAEELMRTTYRDLFPPSYVDDFRKQYLYTAGVVSSTRLRAMQDEYLAHLTLSFPEGAASDRLFLRWLRLRMGMQNVITRGYLFARLRRLNRLVPAQIVHALLKRRAW
jgi:glycosyltransferase involved in cell wall biosynthesis